MNHIKNIIILTMLLGFFGCDDEPNDFVFQEFKSQIEKIGMKIDSVDETGLIYLTIGEEVLEVSLENVRRNYERDKDVTHISDLVHVIASYTIEIPASWLEVKDSIYITLFPNDEVYKGKFLQQKITKDFGKVYVYSGNDKFSWINEDDLKKWNITKEELEIQANTNADKLLASSIIGYDTIENHKLGYINVEHETLKATLLFAPSIKEKVIQDFGFPFYAVIPVRDFCYIFSAKDLDFFVERIGKVVVSEYNESGYPVTTEILKFSDKGVEAIGKYPVD